MPTNWEYIKVGDQLYIHDEDNNKLYIVRGDAMFEVIAPTAIKESGEL